MPLLALVALAAVLRLWALDFGLPHPLARPDEQEILSPGYHFARGDPNPHYHVYPGLYLYLVWLWGEAALALRRLLVPTPPYAAVLLRDLQGLPGGSDGLVILAGRLLSALAGIATVPVVYAVARPRLGRAAALAAAALLAALYLHVRDSHACKPDVLLALATVLALAACAALAERPSVRRGVLAGAAIGVATGMKQPGILLLAPLYLSGVLASTATGWRRLVPSRPVVTGGAVAVAVFLVTSPFLILDAGFVWRQMAPATHAVFAPTETHQDRAWTYHILVSLRYGTGVPFALLVLPAIVLGLRDRDPLLRLGATFAIVWGLVIGVSPVHHVRYLTPALPVLTILVAALLARAGARLVPRRAAITLAVVTAAVLAQPLAASVAHDRILARTDTRLLATRWLAAHARPGERVAVLGTNIWPYGVPIMPPGVGAVRLDPAERNLDGARWVLTHDHPLEFSHVDPAQLVALLPRLRLEAEFSPFAGAAPAGWFEKADAYYAPFHDFAGVVRPGPLIRIYSVAPG